MDRFSAAIFVFAMLAWASYIPVSKSPRLRHTMWPTLALLAIALITELAVIVMRRPGEERVSALDAANLIVILLFAPIYFFALRVPNSSGRPKPGSQLPPVVFLDDSAKPLPAIEMAQRGPLLLVFFRGFW